MMYGQYQEKISTIDFVQILNDHTKEATYYYENNWKVLREMAVEKGYIDTFQILETTFTEDTPFHLLLITTYKNQTQYEIREESFRELIEEKGELLLINQKKPAHFRKTILSSEIVKHWD